MHKYFTARLIEWPVCGLFIVSLLKFAFRMLHRLESTLQLTLVGVKLVENHDICLMCFELDFRTSEGNLCSLTRKLN